MKNWRIGKKLSVAFGSLALALLGLMAFSVHEMGAINEQASIAADDLAPKIANAGEINTATSDYRIAEAAHILSLDRPHMMDAERRMAAQNAMVERDYGYLREKVSRPTARRLLAEFHSSWVKYRAISERLVTLSRQNRNAEALALIRGPSRQMFDFLSARTAALCDFWAQEADKTALKAQTVYNQARLMLLISGLAFLVLLGVVLTTLIRQIGAPVAAVTEALGELAHGNMNAAVPIEDRTDEVGALAAAMRGLRDQLAAAEEAKQEQTALIVASVGTGLSGLAGGDLVSRVDAGLIGPFARLEHDFNEAVASLRETMTQVGDVARSINSGAGEIRHAADDLSHRTEEQAASLEETSAAMRELTATVSATARDAGRAREVVDQTRTEAEQSGEVVRRTVDAMAGIERSSGEISDIIAVIDGISFQTNLLALNAGVEAARAGDAGKGFAVVASEVRALAQRSADAAKDIKQRIVASSEQVGAGVRLVNETGATLMRIIDRIGEVSTIVTAIANAAATQSATLQQVNSAVGEMDNVTQQNAAMVEQSSAAARNLETEAERLAQQIGRFRVGEDKPAGAGTPNRAPRRLRAA